MQTKGTFAAALVLVAATWADGWTQPRVFLLNPARLMEIRNTPPGDRRVEPALKRLMKDADKALRIQPPTVTAKDRVPPSGDKHDYMSLSPYWWPDPNQPDGLPYINRDGEINPERDQYPDREQLATMISAVGTLSLAYFFTGEESYAEHAAKMLRVWFIDTATLMNPNMNFAQAVRGLSDGRGSGIIETHRLPDLLDAVGLLAGSAAWTAEDQRALRGWCMRYLTWLHESPNGRREQQAENNHGSWYDVQVVSLSLFVGQRDLAVRTLEECKLKRIARQIEPDGSQPRELRRTKAEGYCTFNLLALTSLAVLGEKAGVDLWNYETPDGRSIQKALQWMLPYYTGEKEWPYQQIAPFEREEAVILLYQAGALGGARYADVAARMESVAGRSARIHLIY